MPIDLDALCSKLDPGSTILLFGAGSSVPSGSPTGQHLIDALGKEGGFDPAGLNLMEAAGLAESQLGRAAMIKALQKQFRAPNPTGGLQNLPLYPWRNIYTTNFDELIEAAYKRKKVPLAACASNFEYAEVAVAAGTKLFKLHGTIQQDTSLGDKSRLIVTEADYEASQDYREALFDTLKAELHACNLIIIGHSLTDEDIKAVITRATAIGRKSMATATITLLMYEPDFNRARLHEAKGLKVCFGGIDEFFAKLAARPATNAPPVTAGDGESGLVAPLAPVTVDVSHASTEQRANLKGMFNGWPATYGDIGEGYTFPRVIAPEVAGHLESQAAGIAVILGAAGVGKTTAARQVVLQLARKGVQCWEHVDDYRLDPVAWTQTAKNLREAGRSGVLFVDDAHNHIYQLNDLSDNLAAGKLESLGLILASSRNHWQPRVKTPTLFRRARTFEMSRLDPGEIAALLDLFESNAQIQALADRAFSSFSRPERERRLVVRCDKDMFVCLKNIFASEKFDDIILREFASLDPAAQDVYRTVAAMESAGVRVHRQLVLRMLGVPALEIGAILTRLTDIIHEYTLSVRDGIYAWKGRHTVITDIVTCHKYDDATAYDALLTNVVDNLVPTYEIELRTIRELCNIDGLARLSSRDAQNALLSRMISKAPGERVPRHRLIRNFIDQNRFEDAETEVRLFENDFGIDGPVHRYKVLLLKQRALHSPGLMEEDRVAILRRALALAEGGVAKYSTSTRMFRTYGEVALEIYKKTKDLEPFNLAMAAMKEAEPRIGDPELTRIIAAFDRRVLGNGVERLSDEPD